MPFSPEGGGLFLSRRRRWPDCRSRCQRAALADKRADQQALALAVMEGTRLRGGGRSVLIGPRARAEPAARDDNPAGWRGKELRLAPFGVAGLFQDQSLSGLSLGYGEGWEGYPQG